MHIFRIEFVQWSRGLLGAEILRPWRMLKPSRREKRHAWESQTLRGDPWWKI